MKTAIVYLNKEYIAGQGPGWIATMVLEAGYNLDFYDTTYHPLDSLAQELAGKGYDLLLLSATTLHYLQATALATAVKLLSKDTTILLGGIHTVIARGRILRECPAIDYICVGEGEQFILDFLKIFSEGGDPRSLDNIGYRGDDGEPVVNSIRPCTDISSLPQFRHELYEPLSIVRDYPLPGFCYVYGTRGCPYRCSYCCNASYLDLYHSSFLRTKSPDKVIADLLYVKERYPVKFFYFGDEMMLFDEKFVHELFPRVHREVGLPYGCMARPERITQSMVDLFKATGCGYAAVGVECGDEQFRRQFLNRHMTDEQIISAFALLRTVPGITLTSFNMHKYPVPNDDELTEKTHALNAVIKADIVQMTIFFPFEGTRSWDYCIERGLIDFDKLARADDVFSESILKPVPPAEA